jgi:hypothetical protein
LNLNSKHDGKPLRRPFPSPREIQCVWLRAPVQQNNTKTKVTFFYSPPHGSHAPSDVTTRRLQCARPATCIQHLPHNSFLLHSCSCIIDPPPPPPSRLVRAAPSQAPRAAAPPVGCIRWNRRSAAPDAVPTRVRGGKSPGLAVLLAAGQRQHRRHLPTAHACLSSRRILVFGAVFKSRNIPEHTLSQHQMQARLQRTHSCAASIAAISLLLSLTSRSISNL